MDKVEAATTDVVVIVAIVLLVAVVDNPEIVLRNKVELPEIIRDQETIKVRDKVLVRRVNRTNKEIHLRTATAHIRREQKTVIVTADH